MNETFLEKIYLAHCKDDLSRYCFVFPTRRAAFVFKSKFQEHHEKTTWLPEILAVRDLIERLSPYHIADDLVLLMMLHEKVAEFEKDIPFDKFFPWGKILLNDFNEIDQNLVNAEALYHQSYEYREVDARFSLSEDELEDVAGFWKLFAKKPLSMLQESFLSNWKTIPAIYANFRKELFKKNIAYEGMAYRLIVEQLKENKLILPWNHMVFGGFYALSASEQAIFEELTTQKKATIYWDADAYYLDNKVHEAGLYMRRNPLLKPDYSWKHNCFKEIPKNIYITGAPLQTAQVKWLSNVLSEKLKDPAFNPLKSVIVLPDEAMLIPLLYSLPEQLTGINITMGYPVKNTHIGNLVKSFITLHKNVKVANGKNSFKTTDVISFLSLFDNSPKANDISGLLSSSNQLYIVSASLQAKYIDIAFAFTNLEDVNEIKLALLKLIRHYTAGLNKKNQLDQTVAEYIIQSFEELFVTIKSQSSTLPAAMIFQLLEEGLQALKVPFTGEPVKGIQVMGFLETRTLDFENVFILSVNENLLPASSSGKTYIPYSIRKTFKLPLRNEQDAVYAYHFYRLLQRAKEVHLIYDTQEKSIKGGEMSRYLLQIAFELNESKGYPVKLFFNQVNTEARMQPEKIISINKNDAIIDKLKSILINSDKQRGISVSAISDYIACPLRFYFRYIARITKPNEPDNEVSGRVFGNILHAAMSLLYANKKELQKKDVPEISSYIEKALDDAIASEYQKNITTGNDLLLKGVIHNLIKKIIALDAEETPFEIIDLEAPYQGILNIAGVGDIAMYGRIDRVEIKNGVTRIIDYKTGQDEISNKLDIPSFFSDPDKKVMLQLLYYSYLYKFNHPEANVSAGIYKLQSLGSGIQWINDGNIISDEILSSFRTALSQLITEMLEVARPFSQTEDVQRCEFCDYNKICNRH